MNRDAQFRSARSSVAMKVLAQVDAPFATLNARSRAPESASQLRIGVRTRT